MRVLCRVDPPREESTGASTVHVGKFLVALPTEPTPVLTLALKEDLEVGSTDEVGRSTSEDVGVGGGRPLEVGRGQGREVDLD
jgi:hypothetical protein